MIANRRDFLGNAVVAAAAAGAMKLLSSSKAEGADAVEMVTAASDTSSASDRERALKLRKNSFVAHYGLGRLHAVEGRYEQALVHFKRALCHTQQSTSRANREPLPDR